MIAPSQGKVISKYKTEGCFLRSLASVGFFSVGLLSAIGLLYSLTYPNFYVESHQASYITIAGLGLIATFYILPKVMRYNYVLANILFGRGEAILEKHGSLLLDWNKQAIKINDIVELKLKPRNRLSGRPETITITMREGDVHSIYCEILDLDGAELMQEISEIGNL